MFELYRPCHAYFLAEVLTHNILTSYFEQRSRVRILWSEVPFNRKRLHSLNGNAKFWVVEAYPAASFAIERAGFTYV